MGVLVENVQDWLNDILGGGGMGDIVENAQDWLSDIQSIILTPDSNDFEFW